jgi:isoprenylcysteine carboxyl methyltransferase (ICMT) family protein YpbQ
MHRNVLALWLISPLINNHTAQCVIVTDDSIASCELFSNVKQNNYVIETVSDLH